MRDLKKDHRKDKENIIEDFSKQVNELEEKNGEKSREVDLMQTELKQVKEFRRKRAQMQKDLDEVCFIFNVNFRFIELCSLINVCTLINEHNSINLVLLYCWLKFMCLMSRLYFI